MHENGIHIGDLFHEVDAAAATLGAIRGKVEALSAQAEERQRLLDRYESELAEARAQDHRNRETIEQLRGTLDARESTLEYVRREVAELSGALDGV